jgi:hypothetical protein
MQGSQSLLDGGRELAALYDKDPLTATLIDRIISAVNLSANNSAVSPLGDSPAPPPIDNLSVKAAGEMVHFAITHSAKVSRNIRYFVEADNYPSFPRPLVTDLGSSRSSHPLTLPSLSDSGSQLSWYFRAYAQYPGSKPSIPTVLGGVNNPTAIQLKGSTKLTPLNPTGSGTASTTGMQGGSGLGKTPKSSNAVLRTGKLQGGTPSASATGGLGSSQTMDSIENGPTTYFKTAAVSPSTGQITSASISNSSVQTQHIQAGAVSVNNTAMLSQTQLTYATWTEVGSVTLTPSGGLVLVDYYGILNNTSANSVTVSLASYKNGTSVGPQPIVQVPFETAGQYASYAFMLADQTPGTSQNTYALYAYLQLSVSNPVYSQGGVITPLNLKV